MAQTVIMERQTMSFVYQESMGAWVNSSNPSLFLPVDGTEYTVDWDGTTYNCMAFVTDAAPGNVLLGNPMPLGGADSGVPFLMSSLADGSGMSIMTFDEGETREVGVWLVEETVQVPSATVKIKGYSGAEHTYENVPKVWLAAPESTAENPVLVPFTYGEALDNVEVVPDFSGGNQKVIMPTGFMARSAVVKKPAELVPGNIKAGETVAGITGEYEGEAPETEEKTVAADFSGGDMVLEPTAGKYLSKATVEKPEALIPENIAEGVNIAGIIGALVGGSEVKIAIGIFAGSSTPQTVNHGLGVVPDIVIVNSPNGTATGTKPSYSYNAQGYGFSSKFVDFLVSIGFTPLIASMRAVHSSSTGYHNVVNSTNTIEANDGWQIVGNADGNSFIVNNTFTWTYYWIAIAGLT